MEESVLSTADIGYIASKMEKLSALPTYDIIYSIKGYYMSMYRYFLLCLYNEGYIADPTYLDFKVIRQYIVEENIKGFNSIDGIIKISSRRALYAYYKNKDEDSKKFLKLLEKTLRYREYCESIDNYYDEIIHKKKLITSVFLGQIYISSSLKMDKATARLLSGINYTIDEVNINDYILKLIFDRIGETPEDYSIDKDLSLAQTAELLDVIMGDSPPDTLDGKHAEKIFEWVKSHNRSLISHSYTHEQQAINDKFRELVSRYSKEDVVAGYKTSLFIKRKPKVKYYPIACFRVLVDLDKNGAVEEWYDDFENIYSLNQYTTELYSEKYLKTEGYRYCGVPVVYKGNLYYDREQIEMDSISWFSSNNVVYEFRVNKKKSIRSEKDAYISSMCGRLGKLPIVDVDFNTFSSHFLSDSEVKSNGTSEKYLVGLYRMSFQFEKYLERLVEVYYNWYDTVSDENIEKYNIGYTFQEYLEGKTESYYESIDFDEKLNELIDKYNSDCDRELEKMSKDTCFKSDDDNLDTSLYKKSIEFDLWLKNLVGVYQRSFESV